tara:strand:+ start:109 stop:309 length:201 start_codon:yes stop_codon:yes gene_type:complete
MKILEHNVETGEAIERNATAEELAQAKIDKEHFEARVSEEAAKANAKAALLDRLGITEDEAKLLLA